MRGLICPSPGQLEYVDDLPEPGAPPEGWALLEVAQVGICGTDYHIYGGKHPFLSYPRVMGHEVSGRVLKSNGNAVEGQAVIVNPYLSCGHCIACRKGKQNCCATLKVLGVHCDGAMCERILVPCANLYPADPLSLTEAATVEFLAIGAHAVRRAGADAGSRALVIGAGPIGLGAAIFARIAGLDVTLLDGDAERLTFATEALGFASTITLGPELASDIDAASGGERFDTVFDATGSAASMQAAFGYVAQGGALVFVGVTLDKITFSPPEFHRAEMMVIGSRNAVKQDFDHVAASIAEGKVPVAALVTHRTTLEGAATDLPRWALEKSGLIKAIIDIGPHEAP